MDNFVIINNTFLCFLLKYPEFIYKYCKCAVNPRLFPFDGRKKLKISQKISILGLKNQRLCCIIVMFLIEWGGGVGRKSLQRIDFSTLSERIFLRNEGI